MRKPAIIMTSLALIVIAAVVFIATRPAGEMRKDEQSPATSVPTKSGNRAALQQPLSQGSSSQQSSGSGASQKGVYIDYSDGIVAKTTGQKVLFFHAPWCPQCRSIEYNIKHEGVPGGLAVIKVDYDSNQELRQKYEVTQQTTFVKIDDQGNEIQKYVAYNEPTFASVKSNLSL